MDTTELLLLFPAIESLEVMEIWQDTEEGLEEKNGYYNLKAEIPEKTCRNKLPFE